MPASRVPVHVVSPVGHRPRAAAHVLHDARRTRRRAGNHPGARRHIDIRTTQIYVDVTDQRKAEGIAALERMRHPLAA
jgi:hypothetical protein